MLRAPSLILIAALVAGPLAAQQAQPAGYKNPDVAMVVSIIAPGAGHFYAGEPGKGGVLLALGLGGVLLGTAMTVESSNILPFVIGYGTYLGTWIYGLVDSRAAAERTNQKLSKPVAERISSRITPIIALGSEGATHVGLRLSTR